jgi:PKD repeat protein
MATPHVSAVAALIWSANTGWTNAQIRTALQQTALDLGSAGRDSTYGYGLVQAKSALDYLQGGSPTPNAPPNASFTYSCSGLTCAFTSTSSDSDGTIVGHAWNFGDGTSSTAQNPSKTYSAAGTFSVMLSVTDNDSASSSATQSVTVSGATGISLSATGYKVKGSQKADLTWSGASGTAVDVYRDDVKIITTDNDGAHTDHINNKGGGSYSYRVCTAGTMTCSNTVTVTF